MCVYIYAYICACVPLGMRRKLSQGTKRTKGGGGMRKGKVEIWGEKAQYTIYACPKKLKIDILK